MDGAPFRGRYLISRTPRASPHGTFSIAEWVAREFNAVPQGWVQIILEHDCEYAPLPMWGWMWRVDESTGCKLWDSSRVMLSGVDELRDEIGQGENSNYSEDESAALEQAIESNDWPTLERYIDEEMCGARCILDNDGAPTAAYIYDIAGEYVMVVNGAAGTSTTAYGTGCTTSAAYAGTNTRMHRSCSIHKGSS